MDTVIFFIYGIHSKETDISDFLKERLMNIIKRMEAGLLQESQEAEVLVNYIPSFTIGRSTTFTHIEFHPHDDYQDTLMEKDWVRQIFIDELGIILKGDERFRFYTRHVDGLIEVKTNLTETEAKE